MKIHSRKQIALLAIAALLSVGFGLPQANAADMVVNSNADDTTAANGQCTLREAITNANSDSDTTTGDCTAGSGADVITFASALNGQTINLSGALPIIFSDLTITGPGADQLTVRRDTGGNYRIFTIGVVTVEISGLTINNGSATGGFPDNGGAGIFSSGTLGLTNCTVTGNVATYGGGLLNQNNQEMYVTNCRIEGNAATQAGGGLYNNQDSGRIYVTDSSITGNSAGVSGGGIFLLQSPLSATNSTISGNTAESGSGGGIYSEGDEEILTGVTITNNRASENGSGGGLFRNGSNTCLLRDTIVAGNFKGAGSTADDIQNGIDGSSSHNLIGTGADDLDGTNGNQTGVTDPKLGPLAFNGGLTKTHALLPSSPAIDAGIAFATVSGQIDASQTAFNVLNTKAFPGGVGFLVRVEDEQMRVTETSGDTLIVERGVNGTTAVPHSSSAVFPAFDQRGDPFPRVIGDAIDIGAFEARRTAFVVNSLADTDDGSCNGLGNGGGNQDCTLREAISAANADPGPETISFAPALTKNGPGTLTLTHALPNIATPMTISGPGAKLLAVSRSGAAGTPRFRIFSVDTAVVATIKGITVSNGDVRQLGDGGGIFNDGTLTVIACRFEHNFAAMAAPGGGGGAIYSNGRLIVKNSTFAQNAARFGGAVVVLGGKLSVAATTFGDNHAFRGGAIHTLAAVNVVNSTFSKNVASDAGGGIMSDSGFSLTLANCTFSDNTAPHGSSLRVHDANGSVGNCVFNSGGPGDSIEVSGSRNFHSAGYNLSSDAAGGNNGTAPGSFLNETGDQRNTDPKLGPLANNGGPTLTHAPGAHSPVIDKGKNLAVAKNGPPIPKDQRGKRRPVRFNKSIDKPPGGDGSDIGAVELGKL